MDEVSESRVNDATRQVGLSDISRGDAWGNKNWPNEWSITIETGFNRGDCVVVRGCENI